ncbi:hypothetical protein DFJ73DRAFT_954905 [Zopfochytrium polystomum]|nr:hypothetical protein DFJ73DRAFT_954905 [Zopfochytrium polystomum]
MYSRAIRKFLEPSADHANPNLGPGCYTSDEATLIAGKSLNESGFAPFSSIAPRVSYFDEIVNTGPAPGAYDPPPTLDLYSTHHATDRASLFGKSRAPRFKAAVSKTPGPGSYVVPGTVGALRTGDMTGALQKAPVAVAGAGFDGAATVAQPYRRKTPKDAKASRRERGPGGGGGDRAEGADGDDDAGWQDVPADAGASGISGEAATGDSRDDGGGAAVAPQADQKPLSVSARAVKKSKPKREWVDILDASHAAAAGGSRKPTIVWRRKLVPPSIPVGASAFGYKETADGELVPRKPPKKSVDPGPAYNFITSFVEKAKHENHGFRFAKESKGLKFKIIDSPGPGVYESTRAEAKLASKDASKGPAVMTLAPCTRITDEIVADALKKSVPGPGAYDTKPTITAPTRRTHAAVPGFGGTSNHAALNYIPAEQMHNPGPGAYYPEFASIPRHAAGAAVKPQPFGSTTARFDSRLEQWARALPAPGSYEVEEADAAVGAAGRVVKRSVGAGYMTAMGGGGGGFARFKAFGSVSERFQYSSAVECDGGAGGLAAAAADGSGRGWLVPGLRGPRGSALGQRRVRRRRDRVGEYGNAGDVAGLDAIKIRIAAFGSQTERFNDAVKPSQPAELPPPGAYEIADAFQKMTTKGHIDKRSFLASTMKRELFNVQQDVPGPGEYEAVLPDARVVTRPVRNGGFLSTIKRFNDKVEPIPGPGSYLSHNHESGLIRKTFNITLGEFDPGRADSVGRSATAVKA